LNPDDLKLVAVLAGRFEFGGPTPSTSDEGNLDPHGPAYATLPVHDDLVIVRGVGKGTLVTIIEVGP
jgi:hypothetical protein